MPFAPEHETFRDSVRAFVECEIAPHVNAWDEAGSFPRTLYRRVAEIGLLGLGYPEAMGGTPADGWNRLVATEEIARAGSGGLMASLFSHSIGLPPIVAQGSQSLQQRIVPAVLAGEQIAALAITEPGGGFDVARQRQTFGAALVEHQVIRHKLTDMRMRIASARAWLHALVERQESGDTGAEWAADLCQLKNHATQAMPACEDRTTTTRPGDPMPHPALRTLCAAMLIATLAEPALAQTAPPKLPDAQASDPVTMG